MSPKYTWARNMVAALAHFCRYAVQLCNRERWTEAKVTGCLPPAAYPLPLPPHTHTHPHTHIPLCCCQLTTTATRSPPAACRLSPPASRLYTHTLLFLACDLSCDVCQYNHSSAITTDTPFRSLLTAGRADSSARALCVLPLAAYLLSIHVYKQPLAACRRIIAAYIRSLAARRMRPDIIKWRRPFISWLTRCCRATCRRQGSGAKLQTASSAPPMQSAKATTQRLQRCCPMPAAG